MSFAEKSTKEPAAEADYLKPEAVVLLADMRMPAHVLAYVRTHPGLPNWCYFVALGLSITSFVVLVLLVAIPLNRAPLPGWLIRVGLFPRDTLLVDLQLLSPILGLVILCVLVCTMVFTLIPMLNRGFAIRMALMSIQRAANLQKDLWLLKRSFKELPDHLAPEDYLFAFHGGLLRVLLKLSVFVLIPTVILGVWETVAASYATPDGIRAGGMFAWHRPFITWDEVQKVSTGSIDGSKAESVYRLHYEGGSRDLTRWRMPDGKSSTLPAMAVIDSEVRQRGVPWEVAVYDYGIHTGKPKWSRSAFQKLRAPLAPVDRAVFDRVYRYYR